MKAMPDEEWFNKRIAERCGTRAAFAHQLRGRSGKRLDPAAVTYLLSGKRGVYVEEAAAIARVLDVPLLEVIARLGVSTAAASRRAARAR